MLRLITMPGPKGRYWTLTVLGTPCATGHVADEDRAIGAAMNWCRVNGYTPAACASLPAPASPAASASHTRRRCDRKNPCPALRCRGAKSPMPTCVSERRHGARP